METTQGQTLAITKWDPCMLTQDFTVPKLPIYLSMRVFTIAKNENIRYTSTNVRYDQNVDTSATTLNFILMVSSLEINSHKINSHRINSTKSTPTKSTWHKINSYEINSIAFLFTLTYGPVKNDLLIKTCLLICYISDVAEVPDHYTH